MTIDIMMLYSCNNAQLTNANEQQIAARGYPAHAMQFFYRMSGHTSALDCYDKGIRIRQCKDDINIKMND